MCEYLENSREEHSGKDGNEKGIQTYRSVRHGRPAWSVASYAPSDVSFWLLPAGFEAVSRSLDIYTGIHSWTWVVRDDCV